MKISIALCTYNGSKYLVKQINSILNQQDYTADEIIICDDKSTDDTLKILANYKNSHPTIFKIYSNDINLGSTKNFEKAISLCRGEFIFLSDQDDIWQEHKIKKTLAVFEEFPKAEGVFSNADLIDKEDENIKSVTIWDSIFFLEKELPKPIDFFDVISKNGNVVTGATLCINKSIKSLILPFAEDVLHDEHIANILALRATLFYSTENLISYRIHENQQVGMKNYKLIAKKSRLKRIILDIEKPVTFGEYRFLLKKKYLKLKKTNKIQQHIISKKTLTNLKTKSYQEFNEINIQMKSKFPIRYSMTKLLDNLLGKRKIQG